MDGLLEGWGHECALGHPITPSLHYSNPSIHQSINPPIHPSPLGCFARQLVLDHGGLVGEGGHDDGGLFEVLGLQAVEHVGVGVVGAGTVFDGVLDELERGQLDGIEGDMIGAAGVGEGEGFGAEVAQRLQPAAKQRAHLFVAVNIDAADFAGAVVEIEVG